MGDPTVESITDNIDFATEPGRMSRAEAMKFLEQLATNVQCRIDGLKDDERNEELGDR